MSRAVATTQSPRLRTEATRRLPKPEEVPVEKKKPRGLAALGIAWREDLRTSDEPDFLVEGAHEGRIGEELGGGEGWVYVGEKEAGRHERGLVVS